tara:strand:- start:1176 stop:1322 length:147 start_codon:yes stop_codon:yes gene_type:complete
MEHTARLKKLIEFSDVTDNIYLRNELQLLEVEILISIADKELEILKAN